MTCHKRLLFQEQYSIQSHKWLDNSARVINLHDHIPPCAISCLWWFCISVPALCHAAVKLFHQSLLKNSKKKPQYIITHHSLSYLEWGHLGLIFTFQNVFIKCMYSFWHNDSQGSSTQEPSTQNSHQLQSLLQLNTKKISSLRMKILSLLSLITTCWGRGLLVT